MNETSEEAFDRLTRLASKLLKVPVVLVSFVDEDRQFFPSCIGLPEPWASRRETPLSHSFCKHTVTSGEPLLVQDAREHPLVRENLAIRDLGVVAYAGIPLQTSDGFVFGSFCAIDTQPRAWTAEEIGILTDLATSVMTEIELRTEVEGRRQAEHALTASEARFRSLTEHSLDMTVILDAKGQIGYLGGSVERVLGYEAEELVGQTVFALVHAEDLPEVTAAFQRVLGDPDHLYAVEARVQRKDGSRCWVEARGTNRLQDPTVRGVVVHIRDATERKEAEQELRLRIRHARLEAEVSTATTQHTQTIHSMLQRCAEALIEHLDAAFARIWILNEAEQVLELQASAGIYTHLDRTHARVPLGAKIGRIAERAAPHLSNDVPRDPEISDSGWAAEEGIVAFAGYPLLIDSRVVGVLALFARMPLPHSTIEVLESVSRSVASAVQRKQAEAALRESEERFRQMAESIREVFWMTDPQKERMLYISRAYEQIWGRSRQSLYEAPRTWMEAIHPEDRERVRLALPRQISDEYDEEYRILRPDGAVRWIHDRAFPVRGPDGGVYRIAGIAEDVTARKRVEAAVQESEARYRTLVETSPDGIVMIDEESTILFVNPSAEQLFGHAAEELWGRPLTMLMPERLREAHRKGMARHLATGARTMSWQAVELTGLHQSGREIPLAISFGECELRGQRVFLGTIRDISERRAAETALRTSEERFRTLFEQAAIGIALGTVDGRPLAVNATLETMLGYSREELLAKRYSELTHPEDIKADLQLFSELVQGRRNRYRIDKRYLRKDGNLLWGRLTVSLIRSPAGEPQYVIAMVEDIREHKRAEALERKVRILEGLLPICTYCKRIRNDRERWETLEQYISSRSEAEFTHGICPACLGIHHDIFMK